MIRNAYGGPLQTKGEPTRWGPPLLWAGAGFMAGVIFWHLVGFWSVVGTAVLGGPSSPGNKPVVAAAPARARIPALETGSVRPRAVACITLSLNRAKGETTPAPCSGATFHHRDGGLGIKDDLQIPPSGWTIISPR